MKHTLEEVEAHLRNEYEKYQFIVDEKSFGMIFGLIDRVKQDRERLDELASVNRHYYHHFFGGSVELMEKTFHYLKEV